jgi:tetratricopeptide (TPR) repeat protein
LLLSASLVFGAIRSLARALSTAGRLSRAARRGAAALQQGRPAQAERLFRRSLAIAERSFGVAHWRTALHVSWLAWAVAAQDRLDEAEALLARALAARPAAASRSTADFGGVYLAAAAVAEKRKDPARRLEMLEQGRPFAMAGAPSTLATIDVQRAAALRMQGNEAGAADIVRAIDLADVPDHVVAQAGRWRLRAGDGAGAAVLLRRAVELERRKGRVSGNLALLRSMVAEALELAGRLDEAHLVLTMAIDTYEAISAPAMVVAPLLVRLARIEIALGRFPAARATCDRALALAPPKPRSAEPYRSTNEDESLVAARAEAHRLLTEATDREGEAMLGRGSGDAATRARGSTT